MKCVAVLPSGLEEEGLNELLEWGVTEPKKLNRAVSFYASQECFYKIHFFSRLPFRFLRQIAEFSCESPDDLYKKSQQSWDWNLWINPSKTIRIDASGSTQGLSNTHFSALQVKNAITDIQFFKFNQRSSINLQDPDFSIHLHLGNGKAFLSLSSSSGSLHKRGNRSAMGSAPLKENIAAGLIKSTGWDQSMPLVDPMCGSGTFLIEAAHLSRRLPNYIDHYFLFHNWLDFDKNLFLKVKNDALQKKINLKKQPLLIGAENSYSIFKQAKYNILNSKVEDNINLHNISFKDLDLPSKKGIIICNPPYGKRIGNNINLENLYRDFGSFCKDKASGWNLWILCGNSNLTRFLKMKSSKKIRINNGGIDCRFINYQIR